MSDELVKEIIAELRSEFQIPPFFSDAAIQSYIVEGFTEFELLVKDIDVSKDLIARSLLKNYCFYAYNKQLDEFWIRYNARILTWQFSKLELEGAETNE